MFRNPNTRTLLTHTVIVFSIIIMLLVVAVVMYQDNRSYDNDIEHGHENAKRLVNTFSDHIALNFLAVDLTLRRAVERQYFNFLFGNNLKQDMQLNFSIWLKETPQLAAMLIVDENGSISLFSQKTRYQLPYQEGQMFKDTKKFKQYETNDDTSTFIEPLNIPGDINFHYILMTKRINKLDGSFGGIIAAVIDGDSISQFFRSIELHKKTVLNLSYNTIPLLTVSANESPAAEKTLLSFISTSGVTELPPEDSVVAQEDMNGTFWIFASQRLASPPVLVSLGTHEDDIFVNSRTHRVNYITFLLIFATFSISISLFTILMSRQINHVQESERTAVLASQAKSDFLAKMSHELRTPLNAIIGFSQMMDSGYFGSLNDKQRERIHDINLCGNHLLELINDILEFSKGEGGKLILQEEETQFSSIISKVLRIMNQRAKTAEVKIIDETDTNLPLLRIDERKIRQTLLNLLSNAVKFTPRGGEVRISTAFDAHKNFIFRVRDTGIGIPQEDIPKAMSVFGQVHNHINSEGTGLGLPLCKMFAELHKGELHLESTLNKGTTVSVILPAYRVLW